MTLNLDRSFFQVWCSYRDGLWAREEMLDRAELVEWLATFQYQNVARVFEFNPAEGWSRDVTADIANEAIAWREKDGREWSEELSDLARHSMLQAAE